MTRQTVYAAICLLWAVLAAIRCALVALGRIQADGLSLTFTIISGLAGLVGLVAFISRSSADRRKP